MLSIVMICLRTFLADKRGVTAVEYVVIAAAIILAVAAGFSTLGTDMSTELTSIQGDV